MNIIEFEKVATKSKIPLVIDLWAPWCGPCKALDPILAQVKIKFKGQVDVLKINADESTALLQKLGVTGIPTMLAYVNGKQVYRKTGLQSAPAIETLFKQLAEGKSEIKSSGLAPVARILRVIISSVLIVIGFYSSTSWLFYILGGVVLFSAFYDRCPIYKMVSAKIKTLFQKPARNP
jgi:thioredoxin